MPSSEAQAHQARQVLTVLKVFRRNLVQSGDKDLALACVDLSDQIEAWLESEPPQIVRPAASGGWVRSDGTAFTPPTPESDGDVHDDNDETEDEK